MDPRPVQGLESNMELVVSTKGKRKTRIPKDVIHKAVKVELERSISIGSTLSITVRDPERALQSLGYFTKDNRSDLLLDDLWFRCCHFAKTTDEYTLTAEDREIAMARDYTHPFRQSAGQRVNPRALFMKSLFRKAVPHAKFFCPELGVKPVVLPAKESAAQKKAKFKKGSSAKDMKIGGKTVDPDQHSNIETCMALCDAKSVQMNVRIAMVCAGIVESTFHTHAPANDGSGSDGVFQTKTSWDSKLNKFDTKQVGEYWLDHGFYSGPHGGGGGIALGKKSIPPGVIAQEVEGSAFPGRYEEHRAEAEAIIAASGGSGSSSTSEQTENQYTPQRFFNLPINEKAEAEEPEGAWECAMSYAEEVNWRLFCSSGQINFVSDKHLEKSKPLMHFDEGSEGIIDIKWEVDKREKTNPPSLEVDARAAKWYAPPGTAVVIGRKQGRELHEGVWLVATIKRPDIFDNPVLITLQRPKDALPERALSPVSRPSKETVASKAAPGSTTNPAPGGSPTRDGGHNAGEALEEGDGARQVLFNAGYIANLKLRYVFGGGHGLSFAPTSGTDAFGAKFGPSGLDCSGAVSWAVGAGKAAMLKSPQATGELMSWGVAGRGREFTMWVTTQGAGGGHVLLEFHIAGHAHNMWEFNGPAGTIGGFRNLHSTSGYTPRHWPGL